MGAAGLPSVPWFYPTANGRQVQEDALSDLFMHMPLRTAAMQTSEEIMDGV